MAEKMCNVSLISYEKFSNYLLYGTVNHYAIVTKMI